MAVYEIPLLSKPQKFTIVMNGVTYQMRTAFVDAPEGGWILDINDSQGNPLINGLPLVTGCDLLEQFEYLGISGKLFILSQGDIGQPPAWNGLGSISRLWYEPDDVALGTTVNPTSTTPTPGPGNSSLVLQVGGSSIVLTDGSIVVNTPSFDITD